FPYTTLFRSSTVFSSSGSLLRQTKRLTDTDLDLYAIAPITGGKNPTQRHQQRTQPDPAYERLDMHPHSPGAILQRLTQRHVKVAGKACIDAGFGHRHLLHCIEALLGMQDGNLLVTIKHPDGAFV